MKYVNKCPHCGGQVIEKKVQETLTGGINTAFINVKVGVCLHCGEKLYTPKQIRLFEELELKLKHHDIAAFKPLGYSYQVAS